MTNHPSREELNAYSLGQLPEERAVAIDTHISECEPCCETIVALSSKDTFAGLLQEAGRLPTDQTVDLSQMDNASLRLKDTPEPLTQHPRYEIIRLIGKGGMGDVYEACHRKMERTVAIKVVNRELIQKPDAVDRFHREVKAAAHLSHPNIVTAYDADQAGEYQFMVMEYVDGVDLSQAVQRRGSLPIGEACEIARQAAIGLQHAHERGMVHRDIKPHNLMVTSDGTVKILDFGLASLAPSARLDSETIEANGDLTAVGAIMGTPDFISPEQANDAREADIRSDLYSLGATLYFLLSGRAPFAEGSVVDKLKYHAEAKAEPLDSLREEIPDALAQIVCKAMSKDPDRRFQTPTAFAEALTPYSANVELARNQKPQTAQHAIRKRNISFASLAVSVLFIAAIVASTVYYIKTNNGVVRVEIGDPSLKLSISDQTITMNSDGKQLTFRAGEHMLKVQQGDFQFETKTFQIRRGENVDLKVELLADEVVVSKNGDRAMAWKSQVQSGLSISKEVATLLASTGQSKSQLEKSLYNAISAAAGIQNEQWELFALHSMSPSSPDDVVIKGEPLTLLLLTYAPEDGVMDANRFDGFRLLKEGSARPRDIHKAMAMSQEHGYVSLIQPEYIHHMMLEIDVALQLLRGSVQFEAPNLYTGKVNFAVQHHKGRPKVVEFSLPSERLTIALDEKGVWQRKGPQLPQFESSGEGNASGGEQRHDNLTSPLPPFVKYNSPPFLFGDRINSLEYSADGKRLLSAGGQWGAALWDSNSGKLIRHFATNEWRSRTTADFSQDGRWVAIAGYDQTPIPIWDVETGKVVRVIEQGTRAVRFAADGETVFTGFQNTLTGFEISTGKMLPSFAELGEGYWMFATSTKGTLVAGLNPRGNLQVWDWKTGKEVARASKVGSGSHNAKDIAFTPDDSGLVVFGVESGVELRDATTLKLIRNFQAKNRNSFAISGDGSRLAIGEHYGEVTVFNLKSGQLIRRWKAHSNNHVSAVALSPDGQRLACGTAQTPDVRIWEVDTGKRLFSPTQEQPVTLREALKKDASEFDFNDPNRATLSAKLLELTTTQRKDSGVEATAVSSDGRLGAIALRDTRVLVYNLEQSKFLRTLPKPKSALGALPYYVALSSDGSLLAQGQSQDVTIWEVASGKQSFPPQVDFDVSGLVFSPEGKTLAVMGPREVLLWSAQHDHVRRVITDHEHGVQAIAFSSDGKTLATGSHDFADTVVLWDTSSGQKIRELGGACGGVRASIAFSRDGTKVYAETCSSVVLGWKLKTKQETD